MIAIELSKRQMKIVEIVKDNEPITGEAIAKKLKLTRATLRPDFTVLTMIGMLEARPKVGYLYSGNAMSSIFLKQVKSLKAKDIKSLPIIVDEQTTTYDAIVTMFLEDVGSIYVTTEGYLTGIISRKDFLKNAIGGIDINKIPVGVIMTRMPNIITVDSDENVLDAAIKIIEHEVDSVPVVYEEVHEGKKKLKIIGKISKTNIVKVLVDLCKDA